MGGAGGLHPPATFHLGRSSRALSGPAGGDPKIMKKPQICLFFFSKRGGCTPPAFSRAPPVGASPPPHRSSLLFPPCSCRFFGRGGSLYVAFFFCIFHPFCLFLTQKERRIAKVSLPFTPAAHKTQSLLTGTTAAARQTSNRGSPPPILTSRRPKKRLFQPKSGGGDTRTNPKPCHFFFL